MGIIDNLVKRFSEQGKIVHKSKLSEAAYHIRIQNDKVKETGFVPGYFLRLCVGIGVSETLFNDKIRSYSVWDMDKTNGTIDLAIATHSNGVGANWVKKCETGNEVSFLWKKGNFILDHNAESYLMIGDLSALSHLYIINRNLPDDKQVESIIYSEKINELFADIDGTTPFHFYEMPQNPYAEIVRMIKEIVPGMAGRKMVYIGGDSRVCVALNRFFRRELNWDAKQIKTKPFWNPDKKGLE